MSAFADVFHIEPDKRALHPKNRTRDPVLSSSENVLLRVSRDALYGHPLLSFFALNPIASRSKYTRLYDSLERAWSSPLDDGAHRRLFDDYVALSEHDNAFAEAVETPSRVERFNVFLLIAHLQNAWIIMYTKDVPVDDNVAQTIARIVHFGYGDPLRIIQLYRSLNPLTTAIYHQVEAVVGDQSRFVDDSYLSLDEFEERILEEDARQLAEQFASCKTSAYIKNLPHALHLLSKPAIVCQLGAYICRNDGCSAILTHSIMLRDLLVLFTIYQLVDYIRAHPFVVDDGNSQQSVQSGFLLHKGDFDGLLNDVEAAYQSANYHRIPMHLDKVNTDVDTFRNAWLSFVEEHLVTGLIIRGSPSLEKIHEFVEAIADIVQHASLLRCLRFKDADPYLVDGLLRADLHIEHIKIPKHANLGALSQSVNVRGVGINTLYVDDMTDVLATTKVRILTIKQRQQAQFSFRRIADELFTLEYFSVECGHASDAELQLFLRAFTGSSSIRELHWSAAQSPNTDMGMYYAVMTLIEKNLGVRAVSIDIAPEDADMCNEYVYRALMTSHTSSLTTLDIGYSEQTDQGLKIGEILQANLRSRIDFLLNALH